MLKTIKSKVSKSDNSRQKLLGLSNKQADAYKYISLINQTLVFYAVA